jgi:hypothetical protein
MDARAFDARLRELSAMTAKDEQRSFSVCHMEFYFGRSRFNRSQGSIGCRGCVVYSIINFNISRTDGYQRSERSRVKREMLNDSGGMGYAVRAL